MRHAGVVGWSRVGKEPFTLKFLTWVVWVCWVDGDWSVLACLDCVGSFFCSFSLFLRTFQYQWGWEIIQLFFFLLSEAQPEDEDDSQKVRLFGAKLPLGQVEAAVITLAVIGLVLLLIAAFLLGVVIYLRRQRKLRLNRRSILDDGFKLMSKKNSGL